MGTSSDPEPNDLMATVRNGDGDGDGDEDGNGDGDGDTISRIRHVAL